MSGILTDLRTGEPIASATVALSLPYNNRNVRERSQHPGPIKATTDRLGLFELDGIPSEWSYDSLYSCTATLGETLPVFAGHVSLHGPLNLKGSLPRIARGRLVSYAGFNYKATSVRLEPESGDGFARALLDEHGYFEALLPMESAGKHFDLFFFQEGLNGCFHASAMAESLLGETLAVLECSPARVTIECQDSEGAPLDDVTIRLASLATSKPSYIEDYHTNEQGVVEFFAESGDNEVCLAKEGYWTRLDVAPFSGIDTHRFVLEKRVEEDQVHGEVVAPDGSPVPRAFVTAVPVGQVEDVALASFPSCVSGDDGKFQLAVNYRGALRFRAFQRRYGFSEPVVAGGVEGTLRLVFRPFGTVTLDLKYSFDPEEYTGGLPEYFLVDRYRHEVFSGTSEPPVHVTDVPEGEYNLYVRFPGLGGYVQTSVLVEAGREKRQNAVVEPGYWHEGLVVHRDGSGVPDVFATIVSTWPEEVSEKWGTCRTDRNGRFRLFAGSARTVRVEVLDADGASLGGFASISGERSQYALD